MNGFTERCFTIERAWFSNYIPAVKLIDTLAGIYDSGSNLDQIEKAVNCAHVSIDT